MPHIIETSRLLIRNFIPEEQQVYLALFDDERVTEYLPAYSRDKHIEIFRESLLQGGPECITGRWGIFNRADNDFIGTCLLRPFDDGSDSIELGYVLNRKYWGKGVASEIATALIGWARTIQPGTHFVAVTEFSNIPSQKVLEKTGMQRAGNYCRKKKELALFGMGARYPDQKR